MQTWVLSRDQGMAPEAGWAVTAESGAGLNTWALGLQRYPFFIPTAQLAGTHVSFLQMRTFTPTEPAQIYLAGDRLRP